MTTCVKEDGCPCRHILRFYSRYLDDTAAAGKTPKPDYLYTPDLLYNSNALYGMANCKCCPRHGMRRPLWSDLVNRCPDLASNKKLEILAVNQTSTGGKTVTQIASVEVSEGQFPDDAKVKINVNNKKKKAAQKTNTTQKAISRMNGNSFGEGASININVTNG